MMNLFKNIELTDEEEELLDRIHEQTPLDEHPAESEETMTTPANPGSGVGNVHKNGPLQKKPVESDDNANDE